MKEHTIRKLGKALTLNDAPKLYELLKNLYDYLDTRSIIAEFNELRTQLDRLLAVFPKMHGKLWEDFYKTRDEFCEKLLTGKWSPS